MQPFSNVVVSTRAGTIIMSDATAQLTEDGAKIIVLGALQPGATLNLGEALRICSLEDKCLDTFGEYLEPYTEDGTVQGYTFLSTQ
ncbi:hypothetical protein G6O69_37160 [Pseudenhygromyxa sp. WMMC2535]|uniref:hypothetical protein n=1 Tax=Pseudenhygromyxa sp. WMMC2535 TaxID=2712867 RepID=UPI0015543168|nr:hypothetical protein [Pseudenhygromyxa sp. WMMC2535]NVB40307.1 hypothetical protein [Pseudenhygromyxa sp. WMMC2535]NVB43508.1 hypothetical protein [Pseudenhygromyxa sp. WMMC2535]